jgi:hypothetical protein
MTDADEWRVANSELTISERFPQLAIRYSPFALELLP